MKNKKIILKKKKETDPCGVLFNPDENGAIIEDKILTKNNRKTFK